MSHKANSTSSSARSSWPRAIISRSSIWSALSMPTSVLRTAIRARPSAHSSLLHQVVGRAGREEGRGMGFLQTHQPEHPVMRALISGDREAFYAREIEEREKTGYPPFGRLASLIVSGGDRHETESFARKLAARCAARRVRARARPCGSAARRGARALPLSVAGPVAAQLRSVGLSARLARQRAENARQPEAGNRCRSAKFPVMNARLLDCRRGSCYQRFATERVAARRFASERFAQDRFRKQSMRR